MLIWEYAVAIPPNVFNKTDTNLKTINQYAKDLVLIKYMAFNSELSEVKIIFSEATPLSVYGAPYRYNNCYIENTENECLKSLCIHKFYWVPHYILVIVLY